MTLLLLLVLLIATSAHGQIACPADGTRWTQLPPSQSINSAFDVAVDSAGNAFFTGSTNDSMLAATHYGADDIITGRVLSDGRRSWFESLGASSSETGLGIAVGSTGDVWIAGKGNGALPGLIFYGGEDALLARYDNAGTLQHATHHGGLGDDTLVNVEVAPNGGVVAVGSATSNLYGNTHQGSRDIFVVATFSTGALLWGDTFGTSQQDEALGVAIAPNGTIYVSGRTSGNLEGQANAGGRDAFVTAYDASGNRQFTVLVGTSGNDEARQVALDANGNILIAGLTTGTFPGNVSSGGTDAFVAKLDSTGNLLWATQIGSSGADIANDLAVNGTEDILITGQASGSIAGQPHVSGNDILVAKFDGSGGLTWVRLLGTDESDIGYGIALDIPNDSVIVAGASQGDLDGGSNFNANDNNVFVTAFCDIGFNTVPTATAGPTSTPQPTQTPAPTATAPPTETPVPPTATLTASPTPSPTSPPPTATPIAATATPVGTCPPGNVSWTTLLGLSSFDDADELAIAANGTVYQVGQSNQDLGGQTNTGSSDLVVVQYAPDGTIGWVGMTGSTGQERARGLALDNAGNIFAVGYTAGSILGQPSPGGFGFDPFVVKYDANGNRQWVRTFGSNDDDYGQEAAADNSGNVYIIGKAGGAFHGQPHRGMDDVHVTSYDPNGALRWTLLFGTPENDFGWGAAHDPASDTIIVTGYSRGDLDGQPNRGNSDAFVAKVTADGALLWTTTYGTAENDYGHSVDVDGSGNIYVAGSTRGGLFGQTNLGDEDMYVSKFDPNGAHLWTHQFGTLDNEYSRDIDVTDAGEVYVSGSTWGDFAGKANAGGTDLVLVKLDTNGSVEFETMLGGSANESGDGVGLGPNGLIYLGGNTQSDLLGQANAGNNDIFLLGYCEGSGVGLPTGTPTAPPTATPSLTPMPTATAPPPPTVTPTPPGTATSTPTPTPTPTPSPTATASPEPTATPTCSLDLITFPDSPCGQVFAPGDEMRIRVRDLNPGGVGLSSNLWMLNGQLQTHFQCSQETATEVEFCIQVPNVTTPNGDLSFQYLGNCLYKELNCKMRFRVEEPKILVAGYMGTDLDSSGGDLELLAVAEPANAARDLSNQMEIYVGGVASGITLGGDGASPAVYRLSLPIGPLDGDIPPTLLELVAEDTAGVLSWPWPYLTVEP